MEFLTRDAILAAQDIPVETVEVPEWGGKVLVQGMSGALRDWFESVMTLQDFEQKLKYTETVRARLVAACIVDESGKPLFSEKDVQALGQKSAKALQRVFDVVIRLSALREQDVEDLVKN